MWREMTDVPTEAIKDVTFLHTDGTKAHGRWGYLGDCLVLFTNKETKKAAKWKVMSEEERKEISPYLHEL